MSFVELELAFNGWTLTSLIDFPLQFFAHFFHASQDVRFKSPRSHCLFEIILAMDGESCAKQWEHLTLQNEPFRHLVHQMRPHEIQQPRQL